MEYFTSIYKKLFCRIFKIVSSSRLNYFSYKEGLVGKSNGKYGSAVGGLEVDNEDLYAALKLNIENTTLFLSLLEENINKALTTSSTILYVVKVSEMKLKIESLLQMQTR